MKKLAAVLGALLVVLLGAAPAHADDPGTITSYVSDYTLSPEGDLTVVEEITVDFPDPRHGIYRTFVGDANEQIYALANRDSVRVERDGRAEPTSIEDKGEGFVVRIGEDDVEITGEHVYEIRYTVDDAVVEGDDEYDGEHHPYVEFLWDTVGAEWELPILRSEVTVHLPGRATAGSCGVGFGETDECEGVGTDTISFETGRLDPGTPVSVRVDYEVADQDTDDVEESGPLGITTTEALIGAVPLVLLIGAGAGYYLVRRRRAAQD